MRFLSLFLVLLLVGCGIIFESEDVIKAAKTGDPDECRKLDVSKDHGKIDRCLKKIALDFKKGDVCSEISDVGIEDSCYIGMASETGSVDWCDKLKSRDPSFCLQEAAVTSGNTRICEQLPLSDKQNCFQGIAVKHEKPELCVFARDKNSCITETAREHENVKTCELLGLDDFHKCVIFIATDTEDLDFCKSPNPRFSAECTKAVALQAEKASYCRDAGVLRDDCFKELASLTRNCDLCGSVKDPSLKTVCLDGCY